MKLLDIIPLFESAETKKLGQVINLAQKATKSLSYDAKQALQNWQFSNWDRGELQKAHIDRNELFDEISQAFAPVKQKLKQLFGDTVKLHRGQRKLNDRQKSDPSRTLFSFSFDEQVASDFAYGKLGKEYSQEAIDKAVEQYERSGFTTFDGYKYKNIKGTKYFNIYNNQNRRVTDGANIRQTLENKAYHASENNKENKEQGEVHTIDVPIDEIFWITNELGSKEFIVSLNPLDNKKAR